MFVIPQFLAVTARAGCNGYEYVCFKTSSQPMKSPLAACLSVITGIPTEVLSNSYNISPREAQQLKQCKEQTVDSSSPNLELQKGSRFSLTLLTPKIRKPSC
ncbi:hypothetical protein DITRI_Ditri11bG0077500 [Diplodiscus trichospermus]